MLCYAEMQEIAGYDVLVMQRVTADGIGEILRFQRSSPSCRAGARGAGEAKILVCCRQCQWNS